MLLSGLAAMTALESELRSIGLRAKLKMAALKGQLGRLCLPHAICARGAAGRRRRSEG